MSVDWIWVAQDGDQWQALVNTVMYFQILLWGGGEFLDWLSDLSASQEVLCSMKLVHKLSGCDLYKFVCTIPFYLQRLLNFSFGFLTASFL
jgi:hypothetical protein